MANFIIRIATGIALLWAVTQGYPANDTNADDNAHLSSDDRILFHDCTIGSDRFQLAAHCATVEAPLSYESGNNSTITLEVARIHARRHPQSAGTLTLLAGGPGQSAIDSFASMAFAFRHLMRDYDIVLLDQRGTGQSTALVCEEAPDSLGLATKLTQNQTADLAKQCLDSLAEDPRYFTTSIAVQDLEHLRQQLSIEQWNIYSISYGTRVALHYLRRYPEAVRTLILDAVVPPSISLGPDIPQHAQRSFELILERCEADPGCQNALGQLMQPTLELLNKLDTEPKTVTFEDLSSGQVTSMVFTKEHLATTIRLMSYSAQTASILPSMLFEAIHNDNFAPLARQSTIQSSQLGDTIANGMHQTIVCTEDAPFIDLKEAPSTTATYLPQSVIQELLDSCQHWPVGFIDEDFKDPVSSSVPTLILSGEADPITPPSYGNLIEEHLSAARHIVNSAQGHMQAPFGCMPSLIAQFVTKADANTLNTDCLERLTPLPFFVDANGPLP